jgi:transcriptional accessory protein Tex/SPT6
MPEADVETVMTEAFRRINEMSRRLRAIEERYDLTETRVSGLQESTISNSETDRARAEKLDARLRAIEDKLVSIINDLARLGKLVDKSAKKSEIDELKQLVELYAPFRKK